MTARDVTDDSRVYVVTALAKSTDSIGWRSRIVGARSEEEAIGKVLRLFEAREPEKDFCAAGVIAISTESISSAGAGDFVVLPRSEVEEKDKEIAALREALEMIANRELSFLSECRDIASDALARNAGGKDADRQAG